MKKADSKLVLWQNVSALMDAKYGKEHLTRLATDAKIGPGTISRIKQHETSVGIDVVEAIAKVFKVEPWQLLVPQLQADRPPQLAEPADAWPLPGVDRRALRALPPEKLSKIEGYIEGVIEADTAAAAVANRKAA